MFDHKFQRPPLEVAASSGSVVGLKFLLDRGGRIDHVDREDGTTHDALRRKVRAEAFIKLAMIQLMLNRLCPSNADPAFHYARAA